MNPHHKYMLVSSFVFDVDGVLTDGNLLATESDGLTREMNTRDGYALKQALLAGYNICIITGGSSSGVQKRLAKIGIEDIFLGVDDKPTVLQNFLEKKEINPEHVVYMGDDLPDFEAMQLVAYKACPKDAAHEIKNISDYISPIKGGRGCVRDIIEKVMRIQDKW
jgi:3-deoxy-D-manno-octulosonate 8-phosphate phosphatase (KDO 8-P phosphatase)